MVYLRECVWRGNFEVQFIVVKFDVCWQFDFEFVCVDVVCKMCEVGFFGLDFLECFQSFGEREVS